MTQPSIPGSWGPLMNLEHLNGSYMCAKSGPRTRSLTPPPLYSLCICVQYRGLLPFSPSSVFMMSGTEAAQSRGAREFEYVCVSS